MRRTLLYGLVIAVGISSWGWTAETNALASALEQNRQGIKKQIEQAQRTHNDSLAEQLKTFLKQVEQYQPADNNPERGTVILYDPRANEYARIPETAVIASTEARAKWKVNFPSKPRGTPVSFVKLSGRLPDVLVLLPARYAKDRRGFLIATIDSKAVDALSQEAIPRIGIVVDPETHDALGGVTKP